MRPLDPMFDSMLTPRERKTLTVQVEQITDGHELFDPDIIESGSTWLRWEVFGEDAGSGSLQLAEGTREMVLSVQSDLRTSSKRPRSPGVSFASQRTWPSP